MGNTIAVNVGNSGTVVPMNGSTGEDKVGAPAGGINVGNTTAAGRGGTRLF